MSDLLSQIAKGVNLSKADVAKIIRSAPHRYKVFPIRKRSSDGVRTIAQPSPDLKFIQKYLAASVLANLSLSPAAMAYRKGLSIRANAEKHAGADCLLKLDFEDFFPSIRPFDLIVRLKNAGVSLSQNDELVLRNVFFWRREGVEFGLAIGAPSSPAVSNAVMYEFDTEILEVSSQFGVVYTRYADDLTLSGSKSDVLAVEREINRIVRGIPSPRLRLNDSKRGLYRRGMKQMVTGLILTPQNEVSIGRQRKRMLSAAIHRATLGSLTTKELHEIRGWLAFANSVEPDVIVRLRRKYGSSVVDGLLYGKDAGLQPSANRRDVVD